jgi:hypothetical protein
MTLGLIGYGNVAQRVARVAWALDMRVIFHTQQRREERYGQWQPMEVVLATSDAVSLHTPAYESVVTGAQLRQIRRNALVVVTTLGLPFPAQELMAWQRDRPGSTVLNTTARDRYVGAGRCSSCPRRL